MARGNPACWTQGFTWEQCCSEIYGARGNPICWDASEHTFDTCCFGAPYRPNGCVEYVSHFDFAVMKLFPDHWEGCAESMEQMPQACNSQEMTKEGCPGCAHLSDYAVTYIRCVRGLQGVRGLGGVASESAAPLATVGGWHYPTLLLPRSHGRDFSVAVPAFDAYVGNRLVIDGSWMPHEIKLLVGLTRPGDVIVDAGANIGGFALPLAKHVGREGQVHAFEPFRLLFQCLSANVMLNGLTNVYTYQLGLGNATKSVSRRMPNLNTIMNPSKMHVAATVASELMVRHDPSPAARDIVKVVRLDDIDFGYRGPHMIKVDVESMEMPLIEGSEATLRRYRPSLYIEDSEVPEEVDGQHRPTRLWRHLMARGYLVVDLVQSGMSDATSTLFVPQERRKEMMERLWQIHWGEPPWAA